MNQIKKFAVVGHPVAHSKSPMIHRLFAKQFDLLLSYEKFDFSPDQLQYKLDELKEQEYTVLLVKGGGTRSDVETFEVRNGNGTTFAVFGSGEIQTGTKLLANPAYGGGAFNVVNSTVDKNLYMPSFYGSGNVNLTYRHCFNINSDHFAVQFTGGGGNTVFTTYAIISGSHYRDILVQSYTLFYSQLKIKIVQDGSDGKSIWVAGNSYNNNVYFLEWRVFPIKACSIEMNPSSAQSAFYHVHYASSGIASSSSDEMPTGTGPSAW